jgi:hypothetical protein
MRRALTATSLNPLRSSASLWLRGLTADAPGAGALCSDAALTLANAVAASGAETADAAPPTPPAKPRKPKLPLFTKKLTRKERGSYADSLAAEARAGSELADHAC